MFKKILNRLSLFALIFSLVILASGCGEEPVQPEPISSQDRDFVNELKLDMSTESLKQEVTVKIYIDGDTTHFYVPSSINESGVLKARYLAINTPESTGKIEEWGKKASKFTKEKLSNATSIIIESDDNNWNIDSTGGRYLVWVWYRTSETEDYRNLNLEILQNGLAIASNSQQNRYGDYCVAAINQARKNKLNVYSGEKDPDFFYGDAYELTLKELRLHIEDYDNCKVAFEGNIIKNSDNSIYLEDYDEETGLNFGMTVYLGYNLSGEGLSIVNTGNRARIVGTVQYYEAGGTYQVSGLQYRVMKPDDPSNIQLIRTGVSATYPVLDADYFLNGSESIIDEETGETKSILVKEAMMNTSIEMHNLKVKSIYTTTSDTDSNGAMTLTCEVDGITISVRTIVLRNEDGSVITKDKYEGKTIDVKGLVDFYDGKYQIKVFLPSDIIIH